MDGSRMIRVLKRDGSVEDFSSLKLAGAIWRALTPERGQFRDASDLAAAIGVYLQRSQWECISAAAIFEMTVKVLRRVHFDAAAEAMETWQTRRNLTRRQMRVEHDGGQVTYWEKGWLWRLGSRSWKLSPQTARIIAGQVERHMFKAGRETITRQEICDLFNGLVAEYGLADAVPVME